MDRRTFLRSAALMAGGAALGGGAVAALTSRRAGDEADLGLGRPRAVGGSGLDTPRVFSRVETGETLVALTFDDGPSAVTGAVLDVLDDRGVRATFNIVGDHVGSQTELLRRQMGRHDIGNHTWSHRPLAGRSATDIDGELRRTDDLIDRVTGERPRYLRPPGGEVTPEILTAASAFGYDVLLWSVQLPASGARPDPVQHVLDNLHPGAIVLAHEGADLTGSGAQDPLPRLIDGIRDRGYVLVPVSELVSAGNPVQGDAR